MGGKNWSAEEEQMLWEVVIPRSPAGANPAEQTMSWERCAEWMNEMSGDTPNRVYTCSMIYEHYYQNIKPGKVSRHAGRYVDKYLRLVEWYKNHRSPPPPSPPHISAVQDPEIAAFLSEQSKPKSRRTAKPAQPRVRDIENRPVRAPANVSEGQDSGYRASSGPQSRSFTPVTGAQQQFSGENQIPRDDSDGKWQPDFRPLPRTVRAARPGGNFLSRPTELADGYWRFVPQTQDDGISRESLPMAPRSSIVQARQPRTQEENPWTRASTRPPQQVPQGPQRQWNGTLPSIRQMVPFFDSQQPTYYPSAYEMDTQSDKRGYSGDQAYDPAPKRRKLPDHPVPRQGSQQPPDQRK
ncbi:hypothetical protein F53441_7014 [Fusarium austroafricanum]|uniref:Uncharacterized protein n=1 Tax=Fusarium austroafricanum TaxID=2364996 RepID=A0A8H4NSR1_9HYPO|nr:hypothetical protein F53441_7014 [Fusarium austroafricanum]